MKIKVVFTLQHGVVVFVEGRQEILFRTDKANDLVLFCLGLQAGNPKVTITFDSSYHTGIAYEKGIEVAEQLET